MKNNLFDNVGNDTAEGRQGSIVATLADIVIAILLLAFAVVLAV